ncbi:MAG: phage terminase large subunit family protein [Gammaproteobacteria bacterium]|nr:phage terminase large subunit family protein [Gammaproteobacteria bacterium]
MSDLARAADIIRDVAELVRPPQRMTVPEAAEQYVFLDIPGGYKGPWRNELPHYMVEPAGCLTSREYEAVIFAGPAQSGKTQMLVDNWWSHTVICDPGDLMVVQTSQDTARDYSRRRVDRQIAASPELRRRLRAGHGDNTHDKTFSSGMILSLGWPTKNQLAGKSIGRMALTDYDRMPDDVDGEGSAFGLAKERTKTFLSRGMTMAESSPSKPVLDPKWRPKTPHEAPPTKGILGLYNTGDRRRLYSQCPECGEWFMPSASIEAAQIPEEGSIDHRAENTALICTANGCLIFQDAERRFKRSGRWLREGQTIHGSGEIRGEGLRSRRATFWMPGWYAAFQSWQSMVATYLHAHGNYQRTGDEEPLKQVVNTTFSAPYLYRAQQSDTRDGEYLLQRAEPAERYYIPDGVRTLLAAVDVQKNRFEVMVIGIGIAGEQWLIDRYAIREVTPHARIEDWEQITDRVVNATYRLGGNRELRVHMTAVDSGGAAGVAERANEWWRGLKRTGQGRRARIVKGGLKGKDRIRETFPDSTSRKDRQSGGRGDVPLLTLNSDALKDAIYADLQRDEPGPGYIHFPEWLGEQYYDELTAEVRTDKGWEQVPGRRNETFDLAYYIRGLWLFLKGDMIRWQSPPPWAAAMDGNSNVISTDERREMKKAATEPKRGRRTRFRFN